MTDSSIDLCVIGAGAAGLAAGIFAAEQNPDLTVELLDGAKTIGAKILVSGGGRCNVTHDLVAPADFFGTPHLVRNVLATFPVHETVRWFASLGVELKREETGKLFPITNKARTVLDALTARCRALGIVLRPDHRVSHLDYRQPAGAASQDRSAGFLIRHQHGEVSARRVILATGGRSLPRSGSDGSGYELVRRLGHRVTSTVPALVALQLDEGCFHRQLAGLSHEMEVLTVISGHPIDRRTGSLLWTHVGISGPVVMDASRFWCLAREQGEAVDLYGNFVPGKTVEELREWFLTESRQRPHRSLLKSLATWIPEGLAQILCREAGGNPQQATGQVSRTVRERLLGHLTRFRFPVLRDRGWNFAEVTAGGIPLEEINYRTMESKLVPGLHLIGEVLNCDGRIGGFNFQWAWTTGRIAGRAVAKRFADMTSGEARS
jgi:predicted Rossmann fold flavoprotein